MATNTLKTRLIINNKTAADFAGDTTTVWLKGELLVESDTLKVKMGDGENTYDKLGYLNMNPSEVANAIAAAKHTHSNKSVLDGTTASFTTALKSKLDGIAAGAQVNVQSDWSVTDTNSKAFIKNKPTSMSASDVYAWAKAATKPTYTYSEVGADKSGSASSALTSAKSYTDTKIADLINSAPETMDTLGEIATIVTDNKSVIDTLNAAIGNKANKSDLTSHTGNGDIHVTAAQKTNWTSAYNHSTSAHAPSNAERNTVVGIQKNGTDIAPDTTTRKVNISVPTKVSQLTNDSGYKTVDSNTTYTLASMGASLTNGNAGIQITAGGSGSGVQQVKIKGTGATTVTTDKDGLLTIYSANTVYTHPNFTAAAAGLYKVTVDAQGHVTATAAVTKADITGLGIPGYNTTYGVAKSDTLGLVKSGTDITVDTEGNVSVNDNSHMHTIANVTGLQTALDGKAATSHGTHVSFSTTAPKANGTAAVGTASTVSRSDHVHPLQTYVSGNAGSATKLQNARNIGLTGKVTATATSFNGTADINIEVTALNAMGLVVNSGDTLILDGSI